MHTVRQVFGLSYSQIVIGQSKSLYIYMYLLFFFYALQSNIKRQVYWRVSLKLFCSLEEKKIQNYYMEYPALVLRCIMRLSHHEGSHVRIMHLFLFWIRKIAQNDPHVPAGPVLILSFFFCFRLHMRLVSIE